jgi:uncharacterized protein (TIGR03083 family)
MEKVSPVFTLHLFPKLNQCLIEVLKQLEPEDWDKPTLCKLWSVKDIASHILDGNLRRISLHRDNFQLKPDTPITDNRSLTEFLNRINQEWVLAMRRVSPEILINWLEESGKQLYQCLRMLNVYGESVYPVAWAGEQKSQNWMDIGREYTERWLHQQQIREAVRKPGIDTPELYVPALDVFMRALPFSYRDITAEEGTHLLFQITGEAGGNWELLKENGKWELYSETGLKAKNIVTVRQEIAWKIFARQADKQQAMHYIKIKGDEKLGEKFLDAVAVMA